MRLLTFIQMAETQSEMSFELIMQELQLPSEEVEGFVIEGMELIIPLSHQPSWKMTKHNIIQHYPVNIIKALFPIYCKGDSKNQPPNYKN